MMVIIAIASILIPLISSILVWRDANTRDINPWIWSILVFFLTGLFLPLYLAKAHSKKEEEMKKSNELLDYSI